MLLRHDAVVQEIVHAVEIGLRHGNVHGLGVHVGLSCGHRGLPDAHAGLGLFGVVPRLAQGALHSQQGSAGADRVVAGAVLRQLHLQLGVAETRFRHLHRCLRLGNPGGEVVGVQLGQQLAAFYLLMLEGVNSHDRAADARTNGHNVAYHISVVGGFVRLVVLPQFMPYGVPAATRMMQNTVPRTRLRSHNGRLPANRGASVKSSPAPCADPGLEAGGSPGWAP